MRKILIFSFLCFSQFLLAQKRSSNLQLLDAHTGQVVSAARVYLIYAADTVAELSDAEGKVYWQKTPLSISIRHLAYEIYQTAELKDRGLYFLVPKQDQLEEVVVTGQAGPTIGREAVRQVRVIDQKRIQRQAAVNLGDLLQKDLNFQVSQDGVLGAQISLQGMSGAKVKILIDGVPMIGRLDGNIDLNQINLNDIERVEIIEGPMAVQYGTDAVAGTINLITKKSQKSSFQAQANTYVESVGRYNFDAGLQWVPFSGSQLGINLGRNYFTGYDPVSESRNLQWNPKEQYFGSLHYRQRFKNSILRLRSDFFDEEIRNAGAVGSIDSLIIPVDTGAWQYPRALDDTYLTHRLNNALFLNNYGKNGSTWQGFLAYNFFERQKRSEVKNLSTGESTLFNGTDAQDTSTFHLWASRFSYAGDSWSWLKWQLGYDVNWELNAGERIANGEKEILDAALYGSAEFKPGTNFSLKPGLRYAYNSRFEAPLISSLALRWEMDSNWVFRASYGRGFRAPSLKELYFLFVDENHNILGNEELRAETSNNYQIAWQYQHLGQWNWSLDVRFFFNDLQNEIRLVSVIEPDDNEPRGLYRNENIARSQNTGFNLSSRLEYAQWSAEAGAAFIGLKNNLAFENETVNGFNFYPQYRLGINYIIKAWKLEPSLYANHTGQRKDLSLDSEGQIRSTYFSGYTMIDFNLKRSFLLQQLSLSVGVKNLLDVGSIQTSNQINGGAHSNGASSIPLSYGRTYFIRCQWSIE